MEELNNRHHRGVGTSYKCVNQDALLWTKVVEAPTIENVKSSEAEKEMRGEEMKGCWRETDAKSRVKAPPVGKSET